MSKVVRSSSMPLRYSPACKGCIFDAGKSVTVTFRNACSGFVRRVVTSQHGVIGIKSWMDYDIINIVAFEKDQKKR
jgi:hypothetical protein